MTNSAERLAARYNSAMHRTDIEWAVGTSGEVYLRDRESFTAKNTRDITQRNERERHIWMANQRQGEA